MQYLRWPITATAITKRNTANKEIIINKKTFAHKLSIKKDLFTKKKDLLTQKPTANNQGKLSRQIAMVNSCRNFPRQIAMANFHGKKPRLIAVATIINIC